mmetsp:Transcript_16168/g.33156  ORF Transcript_16168/g.33156 Transcript_16168/m.33156 type:complete len:150 (+) Transcript_16168:79-528(+)
MSYYTLLCLLVACVVSVHGFVPTTIVSSRRVLGKNGPTSSSSGDQISQIKSNSERLVQSTGYRSTHMMGLFGLGGPEIAIIGVAAAFLLGPQKLAEFSKDLGKVAGELKDVPKEFQKGIKEGEAESKAIKAKEAEKPAPVEDVEAIKEE